MAVACLRWNVIIIIIASLLDASREHEISEEFLNISKIIPKNYIRQKLPPTEYGEPVQVNLSMSILMISSMNFDDDFSINMYLTQEWQDLRVSVPEELFEHGDDFITLSLRTLDKLWQPDLYFLNSLMEEHKAVGHKSFSVSLFKNKTIRLISRIHAVVMCSMEFYHYPMDTQICPILVESMSYNAGRIMLNWADLGVVLRDGIKHLQYNILQPIMDRTNMYTSEKNGNFSRLIVYFVFERQIGHAVIHIFAPSTLLVVLSWFSFWLDFDAVPGRITLLVTCMLSLVTMFTDLRAETPLVDYVKALDIWMAGCMVLVFGAVAEFVVAKVFFVKYNELKQKESKNLTKNNRGSTASEFIDPNSPQYVHNFQYKNSSKKEPFIRLYWPTHKGTEKILWQECDRLSRGVFPIFFFVFAVIYWTIMIYGREQSRRNRE